MRRHIALGGTVLLLALGAAVGLPLRASAHALLQASDPAEGAALDTPPAAVTITFGEEPDPRLSTITVVDTSGQSFTAGSIQTVPGAPDQLRVALRHLPTGVYTVTWKTVSTVDGHFAAGAYTFGVGTVPGAVPASVAAGVGSPPPSALAVAGRWVLYAGLVVLLGAAVVVSVIVAEAPVAVLVLLAAGWALSAAGTALVAEAQRQAAGIRWSDVFSSSMGHTLTGRIVPTAISGALVIAAVLGRGRLRRWLAALAGAGAAAAMFADVAASHAAAEFPVVFNDVAQWLHIVGVGVWIGGLGALLLALRGTPSAVKARMVRRFSTAAAICLVVVALSGIARAIITVGAWNRLTSTAFGQLILIKLGLVVVLAVLGAINRFRNVPAAARMLRGIRRVGSAEVMVGALALLVAAALVNVAPPVSASAGQVAPAATPLVVNGNDYATTVRVRLEISPGTAGVNRFIASIVDYDTGQPVRADKVSLRFALPSRTDIGSSTLTLSRTADGRYAATGGNLSINGAWQVAALIQGSTSAVEVPLRVTPRTVPPKIDRIPSGNGLTLFTIHLSSGSSAQIYIDPNRPGAGKFHVTFFDAKGNELSISTVSLTMTPPAAAAIQLQPQRLTPGHFVADATFAKGSTRFIISATAGSGEQLDAQIDITPGS